MSGKKGAFYENVNGSDTRENDNSFSESSVLL